MTVPANNSASLQGSTRVCTQITLKHVPVQRKREINKNECRTLPKVFLKRRSRLSGAVFRGPFASRGKPLLMGPFQKNPPNKRVVNRDATRVFIPPYFHFVFFSHGVRFFLFSFFTSTPSLRRIMRALSPPRRKTFLPFTLKRAPASDIPFATTNRPVTEPPVFLFSFFF